MARRDERQRTTNTDKERDIKTPRDLELLTRFAKLSGGQEPETHRHTYLGRCQLGHRGLFTVV